MSKNLKLVVCAVLPAAWKSPEKFVDTFIRDIFFQCSKVSGIDTTVLLSYETFGRTNWKIFEKLSTDFPSFLLAPSFKHDLGNADLYLNSFQQAIGMNADLILEIDCSGAHDASQIPEFIEQAVVAVRANPNELVSAMSTRFASGGENHFPWSRRFISKMATFFARYLLLLGPTGRHLSDLTSGFELFSGSLLKKVFELRKSPRWVSHWWGPLHLFQTEMRAFVCWVAKENKVKVYENPINFAGKFDRKLSPITFSYFLKASFGGLLLLLESALINLKIALNI